MSKLDEILLYDEYGKLFDINADPDNKQAIKDLFKELMGEYEKKDPSHSSGQDARRRARIAVINALRQKVDEL